MSVFSPQNRSITGKKSSATHSTTTNCALLAANLLAKFWLVLGAALDEIFDADHAMPLVVTHGNLLALVLHSLDDTFGFHGWKSLSNPDVFVLDNSGSGQMTFERIWNG